ncbi:hypothetical protein BC827DRAFT_1175718 [Russula dissimulans]|nr:hypothetical protein BC827DRAFT_1175718 [Russula dissimulans]
MSSTLPLPPKPDFDPLPSRPPPDRRQRSPRPSPPPRSRPYGDSYHPDYRSRYRDSRGPSRYDSDGRGRDEYRPSRDDRRHDSRHYEPDRRDYDHRRDYDRDRSRDRDGGGRDGRGYIRNRGRDHERRDNDRGRDQRDYFDRDRRRNTPPRRRSRSRRRDDRSWSPRRRSPSRDRRWRSPTPPPRRRSPDARSSPDVRKNSSISSRLSAAPEPKSPLRVDSPVDVRRPQREPSPSPASPQHPPSEALPSPTPASLTPLDKGKAKVASQLAANLNEDVKTVDLAPSHSSPPIDQLRKPSPQPAVGTAPASHPSPRPTLPANPKRSRNSQTQTSLQSSNVSRSSSGFRMPPIPPHEVKEVVKESLNKEIARLASWNVSQKAAAEPLIRAAERSRHELEMSLLELYAARERRKAAAVQVEEARAGTLGVGGGREY